MTHASYTSYGTRFTSDAELIAAVCPDGRPPWALTPLSPGVSDACSAPVTVTTPVGAAGTFAGSAAPGSQPRTTGSALPPSVRSSVRT